MKKEKVKKPSKRSFIMRNVEIESETLFDDLKSAQHNISLIESKSKDIFIKLLKIKTPIEDADSTTQFETTYKVLVIQ